MKLETKVSCGVYRHNGYYIEHHQGSNGGWIVANSARLNGEVFPSLQSAQSAIDNLNL